MSELPVPASEPKSPLIEVMGRWMIDFSNPEVYRLGMDYWGLRASIKNGTVPMKQMGVGSDDKLTNLPTSEKDRKGLRVVSVPDWFSEGDKYERFD